VQFSEKLRGGTKTKFVAASVQIPIYTVKGGRLDKGVKVLAAV
jgi:hypothetical protein